MWKFTILKKHEKTIPPQKNIPIYLYRSFGRFFVEDLLWVAALRSHWTDSQHLVGQLRGGAWHRADACMALCHLEIEVSSAIPKHFSLRPDDGVYECVCVCTYVYIYIYTYTYVWEIIIYMYMWNRCTLRYPRTHAHDNVWDIRSCVHVHMHMYILMS